MNTNSNAIQYANDSRNVEIEHHLLYNKQTIMLK